jgi:hypothetical protein
VQLYEPVDARFFLQVERHRIPPLIRHPRLRLLPEDERPTAYRELGARRVGVVGTDCLDLPGADDLFRTEIQAGEDGQADSDYEDSVDEGGSRQPPGSRIGPLPAQDAAPVPSYSGGVPAGFEFTFKYCAFVTELRQAVDLIERQGAFREERWFADARRYSSSFLNFGRSLIELENRARNGAEHSERIKTWKKPPGTLFYHEGVDSM